MLHCFSLELIKGRVLFLERVDMSCCYMYIEYTSLEQKYWYLCSWVHWYVHDEVLKCCIPLRGWFKSTACTFTRH